MVIYKKQFYPELNQLEFNKHISPLLDYIEGLTVPRLNRLSSVEHINNQEIYPYHNPCKMLAKNIWERVWASELDSYLYDPKSFKEAICESNSQIAFSYFIRCFAEQIKTFSKEPETPTDAYRKYNQDLINTGFEKFCTEYPIVWGRGTCLMENRAKAVRNAVLAVQQHRPEIERVFGISLESKIVSVESGGDTHNKGTSVAVIIFEGADKLIFKPRSVSGESAYANLVKELNTFIFPSMSALKVLDCGDYGFTSFVEANEDEAALDMVQAGRLACLMYLLNASDMHYSNILWTDNGPIPIDLETLFHANRVRVGIPQSPKSAYKALEKSVYGTGVLPISLVHGAHKGSVDVGFTGVRDQNSVSPFKTFEIVDGFSSDIKVIWKPENISEDLSTDSKLEALVYERCEQVISGFTSFFKQILQHKELFIKTVLNVFAKSKLRYIHNMTYRYEQILRILTDAEAAKDLEIAHTLLSRVGILSTTSDINIVLSECEQLWRGDIPYFSVDFQGTEIFQGDKMIACLENSPKEEFLAKMENLTEKDLIKQTKLIRLAFVAKLADPHVDGRLKLNDTEYTIATNHQLEKNSKAIDRKRDIALWFAHSLEESVLDDRYEHLPKTWIGPVARYGGQGWAPGVLGYDLYGGRVGPALTLAVAGKSLSDNKALEIAYDIFEKSAKILDEKSFELRNVLLSGIGAFSGVSGLLWSLYQAGDILDNEKWKETAIGAWPVLHNSLTPYDDNFFDMIMGQSGSIVMRYRMDSNFKLDNNFIDVLIKQANAKIENRTGKLSSGLAHGLGHFLWFFASINRKHQTQEVAEIIKKLDTIISTDYTNTDGAIVTYDDVNDKTVTSSWCNGLAGLLIAYYEAYKAKNLPRESVLYLINHLKKLPISRLPVICHGSLGVMETLRYVNELFPEETSDILKKLESTFCSPEYIFDYYKNGKGRYPLSSGLMSGQAGALLYLCKLYEPQIKISPLTFRH